MNTSFVIRNFSCVSFEMYISFLWYTDKTGSFNSFLFIYLTVINWDGNTKQRNLHLRLSPGFILHQCCYLNITVVVFVMRTKEYDFIMNNETRWDNLPPTTQKMRKITTIEKVIIHIKNGQKNVIRTFTYSY